MSQHQLMAEKLHDLSRFVLPAATVAVLVSGCAPPAGREVPLKIPTTTTDQRNSGQMEVNGVDVSKSTRFEVTRIGYFSDDLAYDGHRGIYVIHDKESGKEFVGISGVGIAETGSHAVSTGKSTMIVPDER